MAVVREHIVDGNGQIVERSAGMGDDDGAPPPIPGLRVHSQEDADTAGHRAPTEQELAERGIEVPKPKKAVAAAAKGPKAKGSKSASSSDVSDRRRCLELAAATGETDPATVLSIAKTYLEFLTED